MYFTFRRAQTSDFEVGFSFVNQRYSYDPSVRKDMFKLWSVLIENGHDPMMVVEDRDQTAGKRLVAFGTSFFAYDWFIQEAKTVLPPFLSLRMFEMWRSGKRPFLLKDEIIEAQLKDGLNAVAFNWGWDTQRYSLEDANKIGMVQHQSYMVTIARYRLKEFMQEITGVEERDLMMNLGIDVHRDYQEFIGTEYVPSGNGGKRPYLMGTVMEAVRNDPKKFGTPAHRHAQIGPPRYGFKLNEQEVLKQALIGETDEEIARSLHLTLVTVKRRWQGIYDKVSALDPELLGDNPNPGSEKGSGTKQKRRFLIKNITEHPEEFWPTPQKKKVPG